MNLETTASEFLRAQRAKVPAETYKEHLVSLDKNKSDSQFWQRWRTAINGVASGGTARIYLPNEYFN